MTNITASAFTLFDLCTLGAILACVILSAMRGLVSEVIAFGGWLVALIFARVMCMSVADSAFPNMQPREMAVVFAFVLVFVVMRLLLHLTNYGLNRLIKTAHLTHANRVLGGMVGLVKGLFLVALSVLVCAFTSLPQTESWQIAKTAPFFERMAQWMVPYLPPFLGEQVVFPNRLEVEGTSAFSNTVSQEGQGAVGISKKRKHSHTNGLQYQE